jgi:tight adherence protein C
MDNLLSSLISHPDFTELLASAMVGVAVFVGSAGMLFALFPHADPLKERRSELRLASNEREERVATLVRAEEKPTAWDKFSAVFLPRGEKARAWNMERLTHAGYRSLTALATYHAVRMILMLLLPLLAAVLAGFRPGMTLKDLYPYMLAAFVTGMIIPSYVLDQKVEKRIRKLRNALPDVLDLLVVCTESGLGINAALVRVHDEIRYIHPEFAAELSVLNGEIRAGIERDQAFDNMIKRSGLEDLRTLVALLLQSLRFGTSLAETLRLYSEEFRDKRMQAAEEEAAKVATKMIFPLAVCFMPAFFIIALGPSILNIKKFL